MRAIASSPESIRGRLRDDSVHASLYLDPQVFELERIFHRGWVYVAHESEVPGPGSLRLSWIGRRSVIVARGEDGTVRVMMNRCAHRAATVCQQERGTTATFRCAYHGWSFHTDGTLAAVPYADAYGEDFRREAWGLSPAPRVASYRGFVFASLSAEGPSLDDHLGAPVREQLDYFCDLSPQGEVVARSGTNKYGYDGNWKLQLENSIDGYHPNFAHQAFFDAFGTRMGVPLDIFRGNSIGRNRDLGNGHSMLDFRAYNRASSALRARIDKMRETPWGAGYWEGLRQRLGADRALDVLTVGGTHLSVFPNLVVLQNQIRTIRPVAVDRTEVLLNPVLLAGAPEELNTRRLRVHEMFYGPGGGGVPDDIEMFRRVQIGLDSSIDPWIRFWRGRHREERDVDGRVFGQMTDEVAQRAMWREWARRMLEESPA
jgi:phenylpropionate dioxygenase-like ring-hydroxylating dioxygenase large terminal subunit